MHCITLMRPCIHSAVAMCCVVPCQPGEKIQSPEACKAREAAVYDVTGPYYREARDTIEGYKARMREVSPQKAAW